MSLFPVYPLLNIHLTKAKDVYVYDQEGTAYLDLYGGHAVLSIGHGHPKYKQNLKAQIDAIGFYSNSVQNKIQEALAEKLVSFSNCPDYQLFLCNSGAEANENALKLASFHTQASRVIAFKNGFHGRTSAAVAATDNSKINAPLNAQQQVDFFELGDLDGVEKSLKKGGVCAIIFECIQGVGGLDEAASEFYKALEQLAKTYNVLLIADEVQSGFGRTGDFFAFQKHGIQPDLITIAKGMGNGFPIGGVLIAPHIQAKYGMLGTTFGGNHLACTAALSVLEVLEEEKLMQHVTEVSNYFISEASKIPQIKKIKGRGLMLGLEFDFPIAKLREQLVYTHHIFTGNSNNKNLLRILPPLTIQKEHVDTFISALKIALP
ncbi:MAG TPA: aminotransferase class III-fold pyridoxal phosphate-dependent enzyme [Flavobacteriaceae bacterium]|nr:aminotransferase class III-fold pyridoxal phosphate-dependent enzyme [Flavobacteriaceae bacterium]